MLLCIAGALLINKPMAPADGCPVATEALPLGAAFFWSLMNLVVRRCGHVPPPLVSAFTDVTAIAFACVTALVVTRGDTAAAAARLVPDALDAPLLLALLAALAGWAGTQCNITGYQTVSVAVVESACTARSLRTASEMNQVVRASGCGPSGLRSGPLMCRYAACGEGSGKGPRNLTGDEDAAPPRLRHRRVQPQRDDVRLVEHRLLPEITRDYPRLPETDRD